MVEGNQTKNEYDSLLFSKKHEKGDVNIEEVLSDLDGICESLGGIREAESLNYQSRSRVAECRSVSSLYFFGNAIAKNKFIRDKKRNILRDRTRCTPLLDSGTISTRIDFFKGSPPRKVVNAFERKYQQNGVKDRDDE